MRFWRDLTLIAVLTIGSVALVYFLPSETKTEVVPEDISIKPEVEAPIENLVYGIPTTNYKV